MFTLSRVKPVGAIGTLAIYAPYPTAESREYPIILRAETLADIGAPGYNKNGEFRKV